MQDRGGALPSSGFVQPCRILAIPMCLILLDLLADSSGLVAPELLDSRWLLRGNVQDTMGTDNVRDPLDPMDP